MENNIFTTSSRDVKNFEMETLSYLILMNNNIPWNHTIIRLNNKQTNKQINNMQLINQWN